MILRSPPVTGVTLASNLTAGASSLTYAGPDSLVTGRLYVIDNEIVGAGAINTTNNTVNLFRGQLTPAQAHTAGAAIRDLNELSTREMVSNADEVAAGPEIVSVWANGGTLNQAAHESNKEMVNFWRKKTMLLLVERDAADEEASRVTARNNAAALYGAMFKEQT